MNIYFSGIGGVGLGPLAEIALDAGYGVCGSDPAESLMTSQLRTRGVAISTTQDGNFVRSTHEETPIDWLVYTAALPADHPELTAARELGIKTVKRDELLAHIITEKGLKLIAVAGTHGKTTTTGMLVWACQQLGVPVSYSIGTTVSFGPSGFFDPASDYFIYECDEFDRNFLHFHPALSLITSIDYDHPDSYPTKAEYLEAFRTFGRQSSQLVAWQSQHGELFADHPNAWLLDDDEIMDMKLAGRHTRQNATLVAKALEKLGLGAEKNRLIAALESFPGTDRRFEKLAENLYSDYGHHPVEIAATLQMARELSDHVVLVYQPHQNIRQYEVREQYTDCFEAAETIYWLPTYLSREDPALPILTPEELTRNITNRRDVVIADFDETLWSSIQAARDAGTLVLCMGAGAIDGWVRTADERYRGLA